MKYKVFMICKEISRVVVELDIQAKKEPSQEEIKDMAWAKFDKLFSKNLEQENYTRIEKI